LAIDTVGMAGVYIPDFANYSSTLCILIGEEHSFIGIEDIDCYGLADIHCFEIGMTLAEHSR